MVSLFKSDENVFHFSQYHSKEPHNVVAYYIDFRNYQRLQYFFAINELTGELTVNLLNDYVLDRDNGEPQHDIYINFEDNYQGFGGEKTKV